MKHHFNIDSDAKCLLQRACCVRWHIFVFFHDEYKSPILFDRATTAEYHIHCVC